MSSSVFSRWTAQSLQKWQHSKGLEISEDVFCLLQFLKKTPKLCPRVGDRIQKPLANLGGHDFPLFEFSLFFSEW